ncbi:hypothetical protein MTO96_046773, partial [Rhipicephalus appendiculatus]
MRAFVTIALLSAASLAYAAPSTKVDLGGLGGSAGPSGGLSLGGGLGSSGLGSSSLGGSFGAGLGGASGSAPSRVGLGGGLGGFGGPAGSAGSVSVRPGVGGPGAVRGPGA